ncbi:hypothetical protein Ais01nite_76060 [Asanoa ishikariensis]|uniref:Uncharacterized protein n=1 Tax=Asanoa ishikariensis TaxID=137265 RepID=A0A1H3L0Y7_9ACTN|nr:hypothetical protein [Asanoa ishikariensis]GIF69571.1 hypothetical protein Ais01nite_76060 [Asanoa ishikariensis]SDY58000.1 hypothetical protein SAMN05421684_0464 [Asanoa ishikariensis]
MQWTPVWALIGSLIGAAGTFLGVVKAQRATLDRELQIKLWDLRADAYVELVSWTAWVEHWFIVGAPDPHERPLTVTMARTAARIQAFGDDEAGTKAFRLLELLRPHVSSQNISGRPPPPDEIRELARDLARLARDRLATPVGVRR